MNATTPQQAATPRLPVLEVKNLTTSFRGEDDWLPVVRDLSFEVYPGGRRWRLWANPARAKASLRCR